MSLIALQGGASGTGTVSVVAPSTSTDRTLTLPDATGTVGLYSDANGFRLTLTSATPVTTTDVTGATTIYCTPYKGNRISLYTGGAWVTRTSAEFSLALGTLTSARPYDVFCYDNAGTPTLEFLAWTNDTTRATALAYQDGILVKSGDATRRYLGTFYTTATTTTEDSAANRYLWNYYHRTPRKMLRREAATSWAYTTAAVRQANANTSNQCNFVLGTSEDIVSMRVDGFASSTTIGSVASFLVGLDSTSSSSADSVGGLSSMNVSGYYVPLGSTYKGYPGVGRHYLSWLEYGGTGITIHGNNVAYSGMVGEVLA